MDNERFVRDVYHKGVIFCQPDTPLQEVVRVLADMEIHAVMVAEREGASPVGVVSHTDVIAHAGDDLSALRADQVMSTSVFSIPVDATITQAAQKMLESQVHRLLVVDEDGKSSGIVSTTDIIRGMRGTCWMWYLD